MPLGVGVIGVGTVGGGVVEALCRNREMTTARVGEEIRLVHVAEKDAKQLEGLDLDGATVSSDAAQLIADPKVDIVVELIGGCGVAKELVLQALNAGKSVVTANKMLIAYCGPELAKAATENGVQLRYEAAVAGTIPIIKALREGLVVNRIDSVYGILNGTCNYILSQMSEKDMEFDEALAQAVELGFAETPPDLDIEGHDTAHKCQIIASLAYGTPVDLESIPVEGITRVTHADVACADELGHVIKLLAVVRGREDAVEARVHPTLVPKDHLLASVRNEFNAVYVESDIADVTMYYGRGAGRLPTASAVAADIADIARGAEGNPPPAFTYVRELPLFDMSTMSGKFYLRSKVHDEAGALGHICGILGDHGVSIASCFQHEAVKSESTHVVLMTHEAVEASVRTAVKEIDALDAVLEDTHVLHVL